MWGDKEDGVIGLIVGLAIQRLPGFGSLMGYSGPLGSMSLADLDSLASSWLGQLAGASSTELANNIAIIHILMFGTWILMAIGVYLLAKPYFGKKN